jgi:hypothetical protein
MPDLDSNTDRGEALAVQAQALYLANLLILPGIAFALLLRLYLRHRHSAPPLALAHLQQTLSGSIWAGILLVLVNLLILIFGGYQGVHTWIILILYFTMAHSTLVFFGAFGLSKALSGQCWRFPLLGRPLPPGCPQ